MRVAARCARVAHARRRVRVAPVSDLHVSVWSVQGSQGVIGARCWVVVTCDIDRIWIMDTNGSTWWPRAYNPNVPKMSVGLVWLEPQPCFIPGLEGAQAVIGMLQHRPTWLLVHSRRAIKRTAENAEIVLLAPDAAQPRLLRRRAHVGAHARSRTDGAKIARLGRDQKLLAPCASGRQALQDRRQGGQLSCALRDRRRHLQARPSTCVLALDEYGGMGVGSWVLLEEAP